MIEASPSQWYATNRNCMVHKEHMLDYTQDVVIHTGQGFLLPSLCLWLPSLELILLSKQCIITSSMPLALVDVSRDMLL